MSFSEIALIIRKKACCIKGQMYCLKNLRQEKNTLTSIYLVFFWSHFQSMRNTQTIETAISDLAGAQWNCENNTHVNIEACDQMKTLCKQRIFIYQARRWQENIFVIPKFIRGSQTVGNAVTQ